jgi:hypothetical protein
VLTHPCYHTEQTRPDLLCCDDQVPSKILCASWTPDGTLLAVGCYDGSVSVRDRAGNEKTRFSAGTTPAWSLAWGTQVGGVSLWAGQQHYRNRQEPTSIRETPPIPAPAQDQPVLTVGLLDGHLRFFTSGGTQKFKDRQLAGEYGCAVCCVCCVHTRSASAVQN